MSSIKSLVESFIVMIILLIFGYVMPFLFIPTEMLNIEFASSGVYDVLPEWQHYNDGIFFIKLMYFIGYVIMFFGIAQFIYTATRREEIQTYYG